MEDPIVWVLDLRTALTARFASVARHFAALHERSPQVLHTICGLARTN